MGPGRQRVELQIRTEEMHRFAEYGIAAHALYKDGDRIAGGRDIARLSGTSGAYAWLRETIERLNDPNLNPEEFLENTKLELFHDQVFCFTPKGKIIALPRGATPIDFAYAVHTDVGNTCVGAKINGRIMPLMTELQNGDEVEIMTSRARSRRPPGSMNRGDRQGPRRHPARHPHCDPNAICRTWSAHRPAAVPAREDGICR